MGERCCGPQVKHGQQQQRGPGCRHALSCLPTWCASRVGRRSLSLQSQSTDGGGEDAVVLGGPSMFSFPASSQTCWMFLLGGEANPPLPLFGGLAFSENGTASFVFALGLRSFFLLVKTTPKQASRLHTLTGGRQKPVQPAIRGDGCNFASWLLAGGRGCLVFPDVFSGESKIVGHGISTTHLERPTVDVVVRDSCWSSFFLDLERQHRRAIRLRARAGQVRTPLLCGSARLSPVPPPAFFTFARDYVVVVSRSRPSTPDCQGQTPLLQMSRTGLAQRPDHRSPPPPRPLPRPNVTAEKGSAPCGPWRFEPPWQSGEGLVFRRLARAGWRGGGQDFSSCSRHGCCSAAVPAWATGDAIGDTA